MRFPPGKAILVLGLLALGSGMLLLLRQPTRSADAVVWLFADSHRQILTATDASGRPSLVERYRLETGITARVDLIASRALDTRLVSLFMSERSGASLPDLAEVEISSVGKFLRPPSHDVGFLPLNRFLEESGWNERIVPSRLAPWSKQGVVFGIPHDVHPVTLSYRKDLFDQAGVDLSKVRTWAEFHEACLKFRDYWHRHGHKQRLAMELPVGNADWLTVMLLQRGINVLDDQNQVHLNDPRVAQTIAIYAQMVAGERKIAGDTTPGAALWVRDVARGDVCAFLSPDWRISYLREHAPELVGKLAMIPLPVFDSGDAPTSTWGGTMIGIPRRCKDPQASWKLLEFLFLSPQSMEARRRYTNILPPVPEAWSDPAYHQPDPLYGNQRIGELYADLAPQIPRRYVTPFTVLGTQSLSTVLHRAIVHVESNGSVGLAAACLKWCGEAAEYLQRLVAFGEFPQ